MIENSGLGRHPFVNIAADIDQVFMTSSTFFAWNGIDNNVVLGSDDLVSAGLKSGLPCHMVL